VLAIDAKGLESSPPSFLASKRKLMPGWAISLLAFALLAPPLAAGLDAFARARRRGRSIGLGMRRVLGATVPFLLMLAFAYLFERFGWLPATASEALAPASRPSFSEAAPPLAALLLVFALGWLVVRPGITGRVAREAVGRQDVLIAIVLLLSLELLLLWASNPFAVILLIPVLHLSLILTLTEDSRPPFLRVATVVGALLLPCLALLYYGVRLDLGLDPARYALMFVAGGGSLIGVVLASAIAGSLISVLLAALAGRDREREPEITVRGPRTYAGPGSLGGTESALQR
jgi:hypothetical protein